MISGPFTEEFIAERRAMLHDNPEAFRKLWEGEFKVDDYRGSGRTSAQLMTLREGDVYVVGNSNQIDYVWHLLHFLRPSFPVKKSSIWSGASMDPYRLHGLRENVILDHAAWESMPYRIRMELDEYLSRRDHHA